MKGLLLKDFYLIRSALYVISACFIVVGASISLLTSTWSLTVVATVMLGMVFVNTINMDKSSGWRKMAGTMPISRQTIGVSARQAAFGRKTPAPRYTCGAGAVK